MLNYKNKWDVLSMDNRRPATKIPIAMKLSLAIPLLLATSLQVSAFSFGQNVTIAKKNVKLSSVLKDIQRQSGYNIFYNEALLNKQRLVDVNFNNRPFKEVLKSVLEDYQLDFKQVDKNIILSKRMGSNAEVSADKTILQKRSISGTVKDQDGKPLSGVTVTEKGRNNQVASSTGGKFEIEVTDKDAVLQFSIVGFEPKEVTIKNSDNIQVSLLSAMSDLEEVVVIGYGTQKKVNLSGAVASVGSKSLESRPLTNLGQGLQGLIPNLNISMNGGKPGSTANYNIRGTTSINGGGPLILVDNVQMDPNLINPADVESVTVLKDAASTAIYGVRGAYGVVLITTKRGRKNMPVQIDYSIDYGLTRPTRLPKTMNSVEFIKGHMEANKTGTLTSGQTATDPFTALDLQKAMEYIANPIPENSVYIQNPTDVRYRYVGNTDWVAALYNGHAPQVQQNISLAGGSESTVYRASLGYFDQKGILKAADQAYKRYNLALELRSDLNKWLTVGTNVKFNRENDNSPASRSIGNVEILNSGLWPIVPIYHPDGNFAGQGGFTSEIAVLKQNGRSLTLENDLWLTGLFEIRPIKNVKIIGDYTWNTYTFNNTSNVKSFHEYGVDGIDLGLYPWTATSSVSERNSNDSYRVFNIYGQYENTFASKHYFKFMLGYNEEYKYLKGFNALARNLINQEMPALGLNNDVKPAVDAAIQDLALNGTFSRINYIYDNKYIVEVNGRYDGTSRYGRGKRYTFQPTGSVAWRMSEENFFKPLKSVLSEFKIRGSYGTIANQYNDAYYPYVATMPYGLGQYIFGNEQQTAVNAPGLVSSNFTWEKVTTANLGFDFAFLNSKLTGALDIYTRKTSNMLVAGFPAPAVLGTAVPQRNAADLKTKGFDLSLDWKDKIGEDFYYNVTLALSDYQATITKFDLNPLGTIGTRYVGYKEGEIWGYETDGFFATDEEAAATNQSQLFGGKWLAGDIKFKDLNGDEKIDFGNNTISNAGDRKLIGNSTPRYQYSVNMGATYKGFDFTMFWQGIGKRDMMLGGNHFWGFTSEWATPSEALVGNYWTPENTDAYFPRLRFGGGGNFQTQTKYLQSAAYLRLKQLTLGYTLSPKLLEKIKVKNIRVYATGQNLFEFTKLYKNFDPEQFDRNNDYPLNRGFSAGVQLRF
ncbi:MULTISPECIES: TonB-dependent receptor [unclassified Sphingobacterium]|uniref:TonB-dependent receptor n=1 Tax=unclassified Sphingobacterium TaxID=2609468 RepID=UPI0010ED477D|nr:MULTISPECIES: TonB-dependent receptor [unclassified Sphingobacterium]MCS3554239.1 TonB-linked SusC/RagA family outer membrane protein [Sphingobacterium sp. JUb21]TCR08072.1 TonB-linked SusC/RagA family outer membrane protein [Sphingobacterium sp. JUb20]